jgi:hypothetical protein
MFFTHSTVDRPLGWFYSLAIVKSAVINMDVQVSLLYADFRYLPTSSVAGSYNSSVFSFLRHLHTNFHSDYTSLYFHQQWTSVLIPASSRALILLIYLIAILTELRWNPSVLLTCISSMAKDIEYFFMCLLATYTSFENCLCHSFAHLLIGLLVPLVLDFFSS